MQCAHALLGRVGTMRPVLVAVSLLLFVGALWSGGGEPRTLVLLYLAVVTPQLWRYDLRERRLPNRLVIPGYGIGLATAVAQWAYGGQPTLTALLSGALYAGFLLLLSIAGGMGMGDVKLAGVLGLSAGLISGQAAMLSPVIAFVAGGVVAVLTLVRLGPRGTIPFGPCLLAGFWIAVLVSPGASWT